MAVSQDSKKHEQQQQQQQQKNKQNQDQLAVKKVTPMIVDRFTKYPVVNMAINLGYAQYDKLKTSNVTVGDVMTKAENLASYFWQKLLPIVEKFHEPINKADRLACDTLDYVETKITQVTRAPHVQSVS